MESDRGVTHSDINAGVESVAASAWSRALEFERCGQYRLAREQLRHCLQVPGLDASDVHFHLGWCCEADGGEPSAARAHYLKAIELAADGPLIINARYRAGLLALNDGNLEQAIPLLEAAHSALSTVPAVVPDLNPHVTYWLGVCCETDGRLLDAAELYDEVTRTGASLLCAEARYRRLQALVGIGAFDAALLTADALIESNCERDPRIAQLAQLAAEEKGQLLLARSHA